MSDKIHIKKAGINKHGEVISPPSSAVKSGEDSDDEYGKIVDDKELERPVLKKTLSKYGVSNEIVKKISAQMNTVNDSDEEYDEPLTDPELVPIPEKLQHPIVPRSLSKFGTINNVQKHVIENPCGDSDNEYGKIERRLILLQQQALLASSDAKWSTSMPSSTAADCVITHNNKTNNTNISSSLNNITEASIEEDPEYLSLIQRGYKKEQVRSIIKRKQSRLSMTPTSSFHNNTSNNDILAASGAATGATTNNSSTPTAVALSIAAPAPSFHDSHNSHNIAMTPAVHATVIDEDGSAVSSNLSNTGPVDAVVDVTDIYYHPSDTSVPSTVTVISPSAQGQQVLLNGENDENEEEDEDILNARIQQLVEEQRAEFGLCMYDVLDADDEAPMRRYIAEGYRPEDAVRLIFERKGYISNKPLPQPKPLKPKPQNCPPAQPTPLQSNNPSMYYYPPQSAAYRYTNMVSPAGSVYGGTMYAAAQSAAFMTPISNNSSIYGNNMNNTIPMGMNVPKHVQEGANDENTSHRENGNEEDEGSGSGSDEEGTGCGSDDEGERSYAESQARSKSNRNKTELSQYRLFSSGNTNKDELFTDDGNERDKGTFSSFLRKKTMRKMKMFLGLPVGDHHLKHDKLGNLKSEDERVIQKKLRYKDSDVSAIMNMGFTKEQAVAALSANKNRVNDAVNALLSEAAASTPSSSTSKSRFPQRQPSMHYPPPHPQYMAGYPPQPSLSMYGQYGHLAPPAGYPHSQQAVYPAPSSPQMYAATPSVYSQPPGAPYSYGYPPGAMPPPQIPQQGTSGYYPATYNPNMLPHGRGFPMPPNYPSGYY